MEEDKSKEIEPQIIVIKKNKYPTVVHFPHMKHTIVLDIVNDIKAKKPRRQMAREYDVSCYYLIKILKHFKDCQQIDDVKKVFDDLYTTNHVVKPIDHANNYKNNKAYYQKYSSERYIRLKKEKQDAINDMHRAEQEILCS